MRKYSQKQQDKIIEVAVHNGFAPVLRRENGRRDKHQRLDYVKIDADTERVAVLAVTNDCIWFDVFVFDNDLSMRAEHSYDDAEDPKTARAEALANIMKALQTN